MEVNVDELRPMSVGDIADVLTLEREIFSAPWTEQMVRDELDGLGRSYLITTSGSAVAGYGGIMVIESDAHIMTLAVAQQHRRRGVATRLMLGLIDAALAAGAAHLTLELRVSNEAARSLYEKFGFAPVGIRPRYYIDEDALVMWAVDADGPDYLAALDRLREEAA